MSIASDGTDAGRFKPKPITKHLHSKKKLFAKYGHECSLDNLPAHYEYGNLPDTNAWYKFRRWWIRMIVVSDTCKMYTHHLRSYGAIVKERRRQILLYPFRIHPFSVARTFWVIFISFIILAQCLTIPFEFCLYGLKHTFIYESQPGWTIVQLVFNLFGIVHVIVNFFIGYYDEPMQEVVLDFRKIAIHYCKTYLFVDLVSSIPLQWTQLGPYSDDTKQYFQLLAILRFLLIIRLYMYWRIMAEYFDISYNSYMVIKIIMNTLLFWHIGCCLLMFLRVFFGIRRNALFEKYKAEKLQVGTLIAQMREEPEFRANSWFIYITTLYRGSEIIYNASYGEALPSTEAEILLIWFAWYASSLFFIFILAMIMGLLKGQTSSVHKYVEMERQLKDYMRHKQLPMPMRSRILTYYEFRFQKNYFRESEILYAISEQLRQEINMHACRRLVENVIFFRNLPLNLLVRIISCLRIEIYLVNDIIIRANTPGTSMYFISTGSVAIYTKSGKEICHLEDGAHFGEVALIIKGTLRTASVIAVEVSEIYRLDQKDFVKAINPYPDLLANIQHIAAERMEVASMLDDYNKREQSTKRYY